jgi:uncharacterized protein (TIGR02145 family)
MKLNIRALICPLIMGVFLVLTESCQKKEVANEDPVIQVSGTVTDADGNTYHTVKIGTQTWMVENLKTTKYNDGTSIPYVTCSVPVWKNQKTPGFCWYGDDNKNKEIYGGLYNWYAVNSGKLCPKGWRVPTMDEFELLVTYLGGPTIAGGKLKEQGFSHWSSPTADCGSRNSFSSNESGFTGLPGGSIRNEISGITRDSEYWSTTLNPSQSYPDQVYTFNLQFCGQEADYSKEYQKWDGVSVRCIKDEKMAYSKPILTTADPSNITASSATTGGNITSDGGSTITDRGVCWSIQPKPNIGDFMNLPRIPAKVEGIIKSGTGSGSYVSSLTDISLVSFATGSKIGMTYYVRAYATNGAGTAYGNEVSFTTPLFPILFNPNKTYGKLTDIDGNVYKTITIGTQTWMAENLKTTRYNDGTAIPLVTDNTLWKNTVAPAYCWYDNNPTFCKPVYGALYNWYAVNSGKLSPSGWHIPTDAEWALLISFVGNESNAGGVLRETGTTHWNSSSVGTNVTGFTALPGGFRYAYGDFQSIVATGNYWTATSTTNNLSFSQYMNEIIWRKTSMEKIVGLSVRCIKN